ncbi:hypothetical protein AB1Y20_015486 [Prymnesium parvum]|uniref:Hexosyltransferase n=1 Tax=Prymnesium parvum TaxID=97485 RepID=A0AB34JYL9_PRYPA
MTAVHRSFAWRDVCIYVISMASSHEQRAAVQRQLRREGLHRARVWPGVVLDADARQAHEVLRRLSSVCVIPPELAESPVLPELRGTVGSMAAHLSLLYHAHRYDSCDWVMVLADDVVLLPGFSGWVSRELMPLTSSADFVNLHTVRAWGHRVARSTLLRVSGELSWPAWNGKPLGGKPLRSPNLLVSGYLTWRRSLPLLLSAFGQTEGWQQECTIDQLLSRIQYALGSAGLYNSYVVDAGQSLMSHCAVGPEEVHVFQRSFPLKHSKCSIEHSQIYGNGSRSHMDSYQVDKRKSIKHARSMFSPSQSQSSRGHENYMGTSSTDDKDIRPNILRDRTICKHDFHVPHERVFRRSSGDSFETRPVNTSTSKLGQTSCHLNLSVNSTEERLETWLRLLMKMDP